MTPTQVMLAIATPVVWGLGFALAKAGLGHFPPIFLMSMRYGLTALVLLWFARPSGPLLGRIFVIAVVSGTIPYGMVFTGLNDLEASTAILIVQLNVPFLTIMGWLLLREHLGWQRIVGMAVAFIGVGLIAGEPEIRGNPLPLFLVIGGGLVWAFGQIMIRRLRGVGGIQLLAGVAAFSAPQLLLGSILLEEGQITALATAGGWEWSVILYVGLIMTALGYTMWYHLLGVCQVTQLAPFLLINPVVAVLAGVVLLGESLTLLEALGGGIVMAGIAVMTVRRRSAPVDTETGGARAR